MPQAAPHPCNKARCNNLAINRFCDDHKELNCGWARHHNGKSRHERGYGTAWDKLRLKILKRDINLCQPCKRQGKLTPANAVDHIVQKASGGTDNPTNLQSICNACHKAKTASESAHGL